MSRERVNERVKECESERVTFENKFVEHVKFCMFPAFV